MKSFAIVALFVTAAVAGPLEQRTGGGGGGGGTPPTPITFDCPSEVIGNQECCDTDVLGLAGINCQPPSRAPTSPEDFQELCSDVGKSALCCVLPILGQALLCQRPAGVDP